MKTVSCVTGSVFVCVIVVLSCVKADAGSGSELTAPEIIKMCSHSAGGGKYSLTCKVKPGTLREETQIYWLASDSFVEMAFQNVTVKERRRGSETVSKLIIKEVNQEDLLNIVFSCIALSPAGYDRKTVTLTPAEYNNQLNMNLGCKSTDGKLKGRENTRAEKCADCSS